MAWPAGAIEGWSNWMQCGANSSWSERFFGREPTDIDEVAFVAERTSAWHGWVVSALAGLFVLGWLGWLGDWPACLIELQTQAHLSGFGSFGRVPEAEVADLMKSLGEDMLEETAHKLMAGQSEGAPAR